MSRSTAGPHDDAGRMVRLEERQLLVLHRKGDPDAFAELIERYRAPVYGYLVRFVRESESREDLFQEIFLRIHHAAWSYRPDRPLHPWVFTIVANTVRSHHRRRSVRRLVFPEEHGGDPSSETPDGYEVLEARETASWLDEALGRLPDAQREVLILVCVETLSQQEVSEILGVPINTVKTRLRRGRMALAEALARRDEPTEESS
jgi:RNA polymerase sigma-70 factor (ECF subfamily)